MIPMHDYDRDGIETGFERLRKVGRALETVEGVMLGILLVVFGVLAGAVAGSAIARGWTGIIGGAAAGAAAGVWLARRKLVREHVLFPEPRVEDTAIHAPHMPGVQGVRDVKVAEKLRLALSESF